MAGVVLSTLPEYPIGEAERFHWVNLGEAFQGSRVGNKVGAN